MVQEGTDGDGRSLTERLDKLIDHLEVKEKTKEKPFKLKGLSQSKIKKDYVIVILLKTNKTLDIKYVQIKDGMVYLKDNATHHISTTDFVLRYKNYPVIILPEWSLKPISVDELMGKALTKEELAFPQKVIIQKLEEARMEKKKKGIGTGVIIIVVIAIAAIVLLTQLAKKK